VQPVLTRPWRPTFVHRRDFDLRGDPPAKK
jgi:hypothetical protein